MKQFKWPRPPLILGLVLGDIIERYMFISVERYGIEWLKRPVVALMFIMAFLGLFRPFLQDIKSHGGVKRMLTNFQAPTFRWNQVFTFGFLILLCFMMFQASRWNFDAKIVPMIVGTLGVSVVAISLLNDMCRVPKAVHVDSMAEAAQHQVGEKMHMDLESDTKHLSVRTITTRGIIFFSYLLGFMGSMYLIGLIPTVGIFVVLFMRIEGKERWTLTIPYAVFMVIFIYIGFDKFMAIPWPQTWIGQVFPALKIIPSV
jgi:hypothetical protein